MGEDARVLECTGPSGGADGRIEWCSKEKPPGRPVRGNWKQMCCDEDSLTQKQVTIRLALRDGFSLMPSMSFLAAR
jgi:hypothetical protein